MYALVQTCTNHQDWAIGLSHTHNAEHQNDNLQKEKLELNSKFPKITNNQQDLSRHLKKSLGDHDSP